MASRDQRASPEDTELPGLTCEIPLLPELASIREQGFAVDRVVETLTTLGFEGGLVEIGGEARGWGLRPDAQPWWVEIEALPGESSARLLVAAFGLSIATSGDYRRGRWDAPGRWLPHTVDPRYGRPIDNGVASVTVLHSRCMLADAWATALTVLGPEAGLALACEQGLAARFLTRGPDGFEEVFTPAMAAME